VSQPSGSPADLDTVRQILFGAEVARLDQALVQDRQASHARAADLEQRLERGLAELERRVQGRLDELSQRLAGQLDDLSRRQQAHAERVTELLDQVMAELSRRADTLAVETKAALDELKARTGELDRRKLNVVDFGASLATLGQRFSAAPGDEPRAG